MNKDELNNGLAFVNEPQGELQIIFYAKLKDTDEPKKLDIRADDLPALKELFVNHIRESIIEANQYTVLPLSTADERGNVYYQYDLPLPAEFALLETTIGNDNLPVFNFTNDQLPEITALIIVLADDDNEIALFKKISPVELIGRGGFMLWKSNQRFEKFEDQLLRINSKFQVLRVNGEIIILDLPAIERTFGFHDVIRNEASMSLNAIRNLQLVSNIESLEELIGDVRFARKLTKVAKSSPVIKNQIPNASIIEFSKSHPLTKKRMKYNEDGTQFTLDTRVSKDLLIKILNDDLLTSELTKLYYDSLAKDSIEIEPEPTDANENQ